MGKSLAGLQTGDYGLHWRVGGQKEPSSPRSIPRREESGPSQRSLRRPASPSDVAAPRPCPPPGLGLQILAPAAFLSSAGAALGCVEVPLVQARDLILDGSSDLDLVTVTHSKPSTAWESRAGTEAPAASLRPSPPGARSRPQGMTTHPRATSGCPGQTLSSAGPFWSGQVREHSGISICAPPPPQVGSQVCGAHLPGRTAGLQPPVCSLLPVSSCCALQEPPLEGLQWTGGAGADVGHGGLFGLCCPSHSPRLPPPPPPPLVWAWQGQAPQGWCPAAQRSEMEGSCDIWLLRCLFLQSFKLGTRQAQLRLRHGDEPS